MNKKKIYILIKKYIDIIEIFHKEIAIYYGICDPLRAYHSKLLGQTGILNLSQEVAYRFHGTGCELKYKDTNEIIDFDYTPKMHYDGFDPWRIWKYINSLNYEITLDEIKNLFKELEQDGLIKGPKHHNFKTNLYFLVPTSIEDN